MRKTAVVFLFVLCCVPLAAQQMSDEYDREFPQESDFMHIFSDTGLLLAPLGDGMSVFGILSRYNFNFISYRNRGYEGRPASYYLGNLDISTTISKYPDRALYGALKVAAPSFAEYPNAVRYRWGVGTGAGATGFGVFPSESRDGISLRLDYSDQRYRFGARVSAAGDLGKGWYAMLNGSFRAGEDRFVKGVFTEAYVLSGGIEKQFGGKSSVSLLYVLNGSERGMRTWTVREVYELTGDNMYNPSWGRWGGRRRNSRVRRDSDNLLVASYRLNAGDNTELLVSASYRSGERAVSGIRWWDSRSPYPDYYRYLPSAMADPEKRDMLTEDWRSGKIDTSLDWEHMWMVNSNSVDGTAHYIVRDRVERIRNMQAAVTAETRAGGNAVLNYGLRFRSDASRFFERAGDMLGGGYFYDRDQYMIYRYGTYSDMCENDIRNRGRKVGQGESFGYDFEVPRTEGSAFFAGELRLKKLLLGFGGEISLVSLYRRGYYEKGAFPGDLSYGDSDRLGFTTYDAKVSARYSLSALHHITFAAFAGEREPAFENIYLAPTSHNFIAPGPENAFTYGAELYYSGSVSPSVAVDAAVYHTRVEGDAEIFRYYGDLYSEYALMPLTGINKRYAGVELGVRADLTNRLRLMVGGSLNDYGYMSDAGYRIYADENLSVIAGDAVSGIGGYVCSPSPQITGVASLRYSIPYSWSFELGFVYAGGRYVAVNPLFKTERVISAASSPEAAGMFAAQEKLPDASVVNIYVSRRFRLLGCDMFAGLSVNNLLGRKDIIYGGYEQMRIGRSGLGVNASYEPFPSRYSYSYPRSFFATLIINF